MRFTFEASLTTLFISLGKTAQLWLELRSWTGWMPAVESGKGGTTIWWMWWETSFSR